MTEKQLIKDCQRGDKASQYELVRRYASMLTSVCLRYVPDRPTAKDLVQETFIRIFEHIGEYRDTGSFEAWMRRIAARLALQWVGKSHVRRELYPEVFPSPPQQAPAISEQFDAEEVLAAVQALPTGFRTVFNLSVMEGYSHKEIAELLGISESTSRSQLLRARQLLQRQLSQKTNSVPLKHNGQ